MRDLTAFVQEEREKKVVKFGPHKLPAILNISSSKQTGCSSKQR
jgi:hypothetical protein